MLDGTGCRRAGSASQEQNDRYIDRVIQDRSRFNIGESYEDQYWSEKWGEPPENCAKPLHGICEMDMKAEIKTQAFDPGKYLTDVESQIQFLEAAFKSNEAGDIAFALSILAKIKGMTEVAKEVGVKPETLYKSLTRGDPRLSTFTGTVRALGYRLRLETLETASRR